MKTLKIFFLSLILLFTLSTGVNAEFFADVIVTSPNGIWTDSRAYATLNDAITAVGANQRTVVIASQQAVTALTIPSNVTLKFERDGSIANTGQLTINTKNIIAPNQQIFTGIGNIDFASGSEILTGWFSNIETAFALTANDTVTLIVSKPQTITASYSPGTNVFLKWNAPGNILTANAGITVSNIGQITAGNYQIFAGAGNFRFRDGTILNLVWFNNLRAAITHASTNSLTLLVQGTHVVDLSDSIPATLTTKLVQGGILSISPGITLTYANSRLIDIDSYGHDPFANTGSVAITGGSTYTPATGLTALILRGINNGYTPYEIDALNTYGGGSSYTKATIDTALAAIGGVNKATLLLRPGTWVIDADADYSAYTNVTFKIAAGASVQVAVAKTLTFNSPVDNYGELAGAGSIILSSSSKLINSGGTVSNSGTVTVNGSIIGGNYPIFTNNTVTLNIKNPIEMIWFGSNGAALLAAYNSLGTGSRTINLPGGDIDLGVTGVTFTTAVTLIGQGRPVYSGASSGTRILYSGSGSAITLNGTVQFVLRNFWIDGAATGVNGIKVTQGYGIIDNVAVHDCTGIGIWVYETYTMSFRDIDCQLNGIGMKIEAAYGCNFDRIGLHDSKQQGLSFVQESGKVVAYSHFNEIVISGSGYEAWKISGTTPCWANTFQNFHTERNLLDATYADGKYVFNFANTGSASLAYAPNKLSNIFFSTITSPWNGATGNRALYVAGGRWKIDGIDAYGSGITGQDYFVAAGVTETLLDGNLSQKEVERWNFVNGRPNYVGKIAPAYNFSAYATSGTGEDTLYTYTIKANNVGTTTNVAGGIFLPDVNDERSGGLGGFRIKAAGTKVGSGGNKTIKLYLGTTVIATVPAANNTNSFLLDIVIANSDPIPATGNWAGYSVVYDGATTTYAKIAPFAQAFNANFDIKFTGECADAGDSVTASWFSVERF